MSHKSFLGSLRYSVNESRWSIISLLLISSIAVSAAWGQAAEEPAPAPKNGLQIRSLSAFGVYYSNSLPSTGATQIGLSNLRSDVGAGGSAQIGLSRYGERSTFSFSYTPSYVGRFRYSEWNALNHALSFYGSYKLAPRWMLTTSVGADFSSQDQFLFSSSVLSSAVSTPATFDDLSSAILSRNFNNPQLASVLTSAPLAESPTRSLLYGQRMFTSGAQASVAYSASPRLTYTFSANGSRSQRISEGGSAAEQSTFLVPNTTSGGATFGISYSLSPRTQIGATAGTVRIVSPLQDILTTTSAASIGQTLGMRWFWEAHGGVGVTNSVGSALFALRTRANPIAGGSLGFKTFAHTFVGSYNRISSDSYGAGSATSSSGTGSWRWSRPGRAWWIESSLGWEQLQGGAFGEAISGWRITAGVGRRIGRQAVLSTQYAYLNYSGRLQGRSRFSQGALRLSITWSPDPAFR